MQKPYDNLRIYASGSLALLPDGFERGDLQLKLDEHEQASLILVPMTRVDRQDIGKPELAQQIVQDLSTYPDRVATYLTSAIALGHKKQATPEEIAQFIATTALSIFGIPSASEPGQQLTGIFLKNVKANGLEASLGLFTELAKNLAAHTNVEDCLHALDSYPSTPVQLAALTHQKEKVRELLDSLPHDLAKAVNRIGATIIIGRNENQSFSDYGAGLIVIDEAHLNDQSLQSQLILEEECVHYVDKHLGFSDRKPWQDAAHHDLAHAGTRESLRRNVLRDMLNGIIQKAALSSYGIRNREAYAPELLADTVRAMGDKLHTINPKVTNDVVEQAYGTVLPLAEQFLQEVKRVARGIHATQISRPDASATLRR